MEAKLIEQFKLPKYIKGKSFSKASQAIEGKFKGRNDKASLDTKQALIERLRAAQEHIKMQMEAANPSNEGMDMAGQQNQAADGELFKTSQFGAGLQEGATGEQVAGTIGAGLGAVSTIADFGQQAFGKSNIVTDGTQEAPEVGTDAGAMGKSALKGASAGMAFGPWGAAIGGVVGGVAGLLGNNKAQKAEEKATRNYDLNMNRQAKPSGYQEVVKPGTMATSKQGDLGAFTDLLGNNNQTQFAYGGSTNEYAYGNPGKDIFNVFTPDYIKDLNSQYKNNPLLTNNDYYNNRVDDLKPTFGTGTPDPRFKGANSDDYSLEYGKTPSLTSNKPLNLGIDKSKFPGIYEGKMKGKTGAGKFLSKAGDLFNKHGANALQYSGVLGELLNKPKRANTARPTKLIGRTNLDRADEATSQNIINDQGVYQGVKEASAGNLGSLMAGNLAANLGKTRALSEAYGRDRTFNAGQRQKEVGLDRQSDMFNAGQDEAYIDRAAKDEGAYQTAKDARRTSILNSLSNIGREEGNKKLVKEMFGYSWDGKYWKNKKGDQLSDADYKKVMENLNKSKANMFGGYLKK